MTDNFFSKAKADGQVLIKTVNLVAQIGKLKLAIRSKRQERERVLRTVGVGIFEHYREARRLDSDVITRIALSDLESLNRLNEELADLETQAEQVKIQFRTTQGAKGGPQGSQPNVPPAP